METLTDWRRKQYETLRGARADNLEAFTQEWVMAELGLKQDEAAKLLSYLEQAGYIREEQDEIDRRKHIYRFTSQQALVKAERLEQKLEKRRQQAHDQPPTLAEAIDRLWAVVRQSALAGKVDLSRLPNSLGQLTLERAAGKVKPAILSLIKAVKLSHLDKQEAAWVERILKLFDASHNSYVSITNVLLNFKKLHAEMEAGKYTVQIADHAALDGMPLKPFKPIPNKLLCPICRRFKQTYEASGLISGGPKMDSTFQIYRTSKKGEKKDKGKRTEMGICAYCFLSGYVDLPAALITKPKGGQGINKGREYLFITTPLARNDLQTLLDFISRRTLEEPVAQAAEAEEETEEEIGEGDDIEAIAADEAVTAEGETEPEETEEDLSVAGLAQLILEKFGVEHYERLAVLGVSAKRLHELRGFVLPGAGGWQRVVAVRVPVERLVGEAKISGAVRRELVKATMYDFWTITGGTLHYNRIAEAPFSVEGQPIEWEEMYRANVAYRIADRYARVGKYRQLNSGLFMLLLSNPRQAANTILRSQHRVKRYAPGTEKVKEVVELTEKIAHQDWVFDLGLRIVATLVEVGLLKKAEGFRFGPGPDDVFTGVELVKWLQRIKMIRDETSARAWGNMLLNALKRGDLAYKDYILSKGGQISAPGEATVRKILDLVDGEEGIIQICARHGARLSEVSRQIANMDYYLLFYYNQQQAQQQPEGERQ